MSGLLQSLPQDCRVAIYCRVSSTGQEDNSSLATQEDRCRDFATANEWTIEEVFHDVHTGSEWRERAGLTRLRANAREKKYDVVLAYAVDRLSRKQSHLAILAEELEQAGIALEFVTERFEDTAVGEFIRNAKAFAAEIEREKISERTVRGRIERVRSGKLIPGGKPLYGYRWRDADKGQLVEDSVTAPVVRRVFKAIARGVSLRSVILVLNAEGIPTPTGRGKIWHASTLSAILHKPAYKGEAYGWGLRKGGIQPQRFDPDKAIRLPDGTIPPLIDAATWEAVQKTLARNKARAIRSARNPEAALLRGGFAKCGYCGSTIRARPTSGTDGARAEYHCASPTREPGSCKGHSIRAHILDAFVWERARDILTDPDIIARELERLRHDDPTETDLLTINRALAELERQQTNLVRAVSLMDDPVATAPLVAQLQSVSDRAKSLQAERQEVLHRRELWQATQTDFDNLLAWCLTVASNVDDLSWEQKRLALDALGFSVRLFAADHSPRFLVTAAIDPSLVTTTT